MAMPIQSRIPSGIARSPALSRRYAARCSPLVRFSRCKIGQLRPGAPRSCQGDANIPLQWENPDTGRSGSAEPSFPEAKLPPQPRTPGQQLGAVCGLVAAAAVSMAYIAGRAQASPAAAAPTPPPPTATVMHSSSKPHNSRKPRSEWVQYKVLQLFALPTYGKVMAVIAVALPVLLVGGVLYHAATKCSWSQALATSYQVLNNCPGVDVVNESNPAAQLVLNLIYVAGLLSFAVVLGIVADDISNAVYQVRRGNHPLVEKGHTVILGWNRQTVPLLRQMALAMRETEGLGTPVVLLADRDKADMDDELMEELADSGLQVISRTGHPASRGDLERVAATAAKTVVVLWPEDTPVAEATAHQAAAVSALKAAGGVVGQKVVVQAEKSGDVDDFQASKMALNLANKDAAEATIVVTNGEERMAQLLAQVAGQPGLDEVLTDLLQYEEDEAGAEFYMASFPALEGKRYGEVRRSFATAIPIGFVDSSRRLQLNPKDKDPLPQGAQLVFVSQHPPHITPLDAPLETQKLKLGGKLSKKSLRKRLVVLNFGEDPTPILQSLSEFCARGSHVTLISETVNQEAVQKVKRRGVHIRTLVGNPSSMRMLRQAELTKADGVVLAGLQQQQDSQLADSQVVASVLQVQALAAEAGAKRSQPLAITTTINSPSTEDVLWHVVLSYHQDLKGAAAGTYQEERAAAAGRPRKLRQLKEPVVIEPVSLNLLCPQELMSGMLTQAAIAPHLSTVFAELFTAHDGHELYLHDAAKAYGLKPGTTARWADVSETVRSKGKTAIGIVPKNVSQPLKLGLGAEEVVTFQEGDRLVVLATEY